MNMTPAGEGASAFTLDDRQWLLEFRVLVQSQVSFLQGIWHRASDLTDRAAELLVWYDGRFQTARELVDECANHNWNGTIYEAWVWETANRVHELMAALSAENHIAAQAVEVYARYVGYFDASYDEAMSAIDEVIRMCGDEL